LAQLAPMLSGIAPEAIPDAIQRLNPLLQMQANAQADIEKVQRINTAVANIRDPAQRSATIAMIGMAEAGVRPTEAQISKMLPALAVVDPAVMNSAFGAWQSTGQTWGNVRSAFHLPRSAIPDDIAYTGPPGKSREMTGEEEKASMLGQNMVVQDANIRQLTAQGVRIDFKGSWLAGMDKPGAWTGFVNSQQNPQIRQLLNSTLEYAQSVTFMESGAQTNPRESFIKQQALLPSKGDDDETIRVKQTLRDVMNMSMLDRMGGKLTATEMVDRGLAVPSLTPEMRRALMNQRRDAVIYDQARKSGRAPIQADDNPTTPANFNSQIQTSNEIIQRTLGKNSKAPAKKNPSSTAPLGAGTSW
jgi:hypothetical protein